MTERAERSTLLAIAIAVSSTLIRLIPLQWLHPLNWDELEFFRATAWIAEGRVPYRDFWEHHTPLVWFLFAPFAALTRGTGVDAVLALRWAQVPVWLATFWLVNRWMRDLGIERFARWAALALVVSSSLFMLPAVEFRVEAVPCALLVAGLILAQRNHPFPAGLAFCLVVFANLRFAPIIAAAVALLLVMREERWRINVRTGWIIAGGLAGLAVCLLYFVGTDSLVHLYQNIWVDNRAERYYQRVGGRFVHRLLVPFGVRIIGSDRLFELAAVDIGGCAVLLLGFGGMAYALLRWRKPDRLFLIAALQVVNLLFISVMKFIFNYHLAVVVILMIPPIALLLDRIPSRRAVLALLVAAWSVHGFAAIFRGKELDLAYQDLIMREVHARTSPREKVWSGAAWPIRREPAYHYWFLPELVGRMVMHGEGARYEMKDVLRDPPGALVFDHNVAVWLSAVQFDLAPHFVHHYMPLWRELWIPAMNARVTPRAPAAKWMVPKDGDYRLFTSAALASHPWFRHPLSTAIYKEADASRLTIRLPLPVTREDLQWWIDGRPTTLGTLVRLHKGQRVAVVSVSSEDLAVILLPTADRVLFRQPPPGVSLEAETTRVTHVPVIGVKIEP
jgi:hypothetical protein